MISKAIKSIGVELECGFDDSGKDLMYDHFRGDSHFSSGRDGSVYVGNSDIASAEIKYWSEDFEVMKSFLKFMYNDVEVRTNSSCGFHTHVMFVNPRLGVLMSSTKRFQEGFIKDYKAKYSRNQKYLSRLDVSFCRYKEFDFTAVMRQAFGGYRDDSRYRAVNINSYKQYRTVEFRILPYQTTAEEAISSLQFLISEIDKFYGRFDPNKVVSLRTKNTVPKAVASD